MVQLSLGERVGIAVDQQMSTSAKSISWYYTTRGVSKKLYDTRWSHQMVQLSLGERGGIAVDSQMRTSAKSVCFWWKYIMKYRKCSTTSSYISLYHRTNPVKWRFKHTLQINWFERIITSVHNSDIQKYQTRLYRNKYCYLLYFNFISTTTMKILLNAFTIAAFLSTSVFGVSAICVNMYMFCLSIITLLTSITNMPLACYHLFFSQNSWIQDLENVMTLAAILLPIKMPMVSPPKSNPVLNRMILML